MLQFSPITAAPWTMLIYYTKNTNLITTRYLTRQITRLVIDDCTVLEQANLTKLHTFAAKHKVNTYSENFFQSDDSAPIWS